MEYSANLGFIGLGVMGEAMCRNMTGANSGAMTIFDLVDAPLQRLATDGARIASSVAAVAETADIIFLSLPGGPQVTATVLGDDGLMAHGRPGQIIVDMSTCPVATTRSIADRVAEKGMIFADAPVARTRQAAIDGTLSIMVGGSLETFDAIKPYLSAAASDITHCGNVGTGQVVKLMNNMVLFQSVVALAEALTIGARAGVEPEVLADALSKGSADSFALRNHGRKAMLPGEFPTAAFATDYAIKDITYALELAADCKVDAQAAAYAKATLERSSAAGYGAEYFPALIKLIEQESS